MPRTRYLKPGFFRHDVLGQLSFAHRLAFAGLWTEADRRGRLEDRPARLRAVLFPYDSVDMDAILADLARVGLIHRYEAAGLRIVQVLNFERHQKPHPREVESVLPAARPRRTGRTQARPKPHLGQTQVIPRSDQGHTQVVSSRAQYLVPVQDPDQDQEPFDAPQAHPVEHSHPAKPRKSPRPHGREPPKRTGLMPVHAPRPSWRHYLSLAHSVLDDRQDGDLEADDAAAFKAACGRAGWGYDGQVAGQALDAARRIRATRTALPRAEMG